MLFGQKVLFYGVLAYDLYNNQQDPSLCPIALSLQWAHLAAREAHTQNNEVLEENALDNFFLEYYKAPLGCSRNALQIFRFPKWDGLAWFKTVVVLVVVAMHLM